MKLRRFIFVPLMMKKIFYLVLSGAAFVALKGCIFGKSKTVQNADQVNPTTSVYGIELKSLEGSGKLDLNAYKGKKILFVNVASECGYTPQYEGLQKLYEKMKDSLVIIGCPCNQFGGQEPGTAENISAFCKKNYGVTFPLSEKLEVKGTGIHPLYKWLTQKSLNGALDAQVGWNFNKFLVGRDGKLEAYFPSGVEPGSAELLAAIRK